MPSRVRPWSPQPARKDVGNSQALRRFVAQIEPTLAAVNAFLDMVDAELLAHDILFRMYGIAAHPNNRCFKAAQSGLNLSLIHI